jgi:hypothetical protein
MIQITIGLDLTEEKSSQIFAKKLGEKMKIYHPIFLIMPDFKILKLFQLQKIQI